MASKRKRMTLVITPEMELSLAGIKKELFCNCSRSEMIRALVEQGLNVIKDQKQNNLTKQLI